MCQIKISSQNIHPKQIFIFCGTYLFSFSCSDNLWQNEAAEMLVHDKHHQHNVHSCHNCNHCYCPGHLYHYTYCSYWVLWRRRQRQCFRPGSFVQLSGRNILDIPCIILSVSNVKSKKKKNYCSNRKFRPTIGPEHSGHSWSGIVSVWCKIWYCQCLM